MFDFHEKRKLRSWLFSTPTIAFLLIASFFLGKSVYGRYQKERETAAVYAERSAELAHLKAQAAILSAKVKYMQSERGIEEEIHDRFDVAKANEEAVIVTDDRSSATVVSATSAPATVEVERSMWSRVFFWR